MYRVTETTELKQLNNKIQVVAEDIDSVMPIEHINEFKCTKCGNVHSITSQNGKEVLGLLE